MKDWLEQAACRGMDIELFIPPFGAPPNSTDEAKQVCAGCTVRGECLSYARSIPTDRLFGVWGGLSERQRRTSRAPLMAVRCAWCRGEFVPPRRGVRYCSDDCRTEVHNDQQRQHRIRTTTDGVYRDTSGHTWGMTG